MRIVDLFVASAAMVPQLSAANRVYWRNIGRRNGGIEGDEWGRESTGHLRRYPSTRRMEVLSMSMSMQTEDFEFSMPDAASFSLSMPATNESEVVEESYSNDISLNVYAPLL